MAFDPSVIATIGDNTPDVSGSIAKGLTLADLYDQTKIRRGAMREHEQEQSDMAYAKDVLAKVNLSDPEAQNAALAKITQRSPQLGMRLMKEFQSTAAGKADNDRAQLELYQAKNEIIGQAVLGLKTKHDQIVEAYQKANPNAPPEAIEKAVHDAMQQDVLQTVGTIREQRLPNGQPVLNEQDMQNLKQGLGQGYNRQFIDGLVVKSGQARQALTQRLAERRDARAERTTEVAEKRLELAEDSAQRKKTGEEEGLLDGDDAKFMAQQYLAGDKSVMTGLGRGAQGAKNIITVRRAIRDEATKQGLNPTDVAARVAEYNGYVSEQRALGTRLANIETASTEANKLIDVAKKASEAVPRGQFLAWNKLSQMSETQMSDPKLAQLKAATLAVVNTWARAISPSGVPTVADKEHANSVLNAAQSPEAFAAVLDQFKTEIQAALNSPQDVKQALHDRFVQGSTGAGGGGAAAPPPAAAPPAPAGTPKVVNWADLK